MAPDKASSDIETDIKATIEAWTQTLIDEQFDSWIDYWTEDAFLMPPGHATLKGRDKILAFARGSFPPAKRYAFSDWHIELQGDLAVTANHILWGEDHFKQIIVLRRQDNDWKVQMVMFNDGVA